MKTYDSILSNVVCPLSSCKMSDNCVRHAAYLKALAEEDSFQVLNTTKFQPSADACPHYLVKKTCRMARGFQALYDSVPRANCHYFWGRTPFPSETAWYRAKRGETLLMPEEQKALLDVFRRNGADVSIGFDRYVMKEVVVKG